ncbi:erythromycin esterase family protein [Saccharothrix syringae]|uniref:erythromycin esterase family protein n=1 Tax=Saccharothrix syringae TaxID=103733 RepID=UPI000525FBAA|nr:erythromycin esterase family protein [Saccharothrix syringae]
MSVPSPGSPFTDRLRDIIGDARVVATGEHSHFIDEFDSLRRRVPRFLVERRGFTAPAFEYGFAGGLPLDAWVRGEGADIPAAGGSPRSPRSPPTCAGSTRRCCRWSRRRRGSPSPATGTTTTSPRAAWKPLARATTDALGDDYFALGLTSTTGRTAEMRRDGGTPFGFAIDGTPPGPPEPGSVEAAFADAGLGLHIADLRRARRELAGAGPDRIRMQSTYLHTPVLDAFDGILNTPTSTIAGDLGG